VVVGVWILVGERGRKHLISDGEDNDVSGGE
jgi:hypothetical protein